MNAEVRKNSTECSSASDTPILPGHVDAATLSWAKERLDALAHRRRQLLRQAAYSCLPAAQAAMLLAYMGDSGLRWERVESIIGEDGVGIVLTAGVIALVVLIRALYLLATQGATARVPRRRLAERRVRYLPAHYGQRSMLVSEVTGQETVVSEERQEPPTRRRCQDPKDQDIADRRDRLDELHREERVLRTRRGWLWTGVVLPVLYMLPAIWLEQRIEEITEAGGVVGMLLLALCPIASAGWLALDHRKRGVIEQRIAVEEGTLRDRFNLAYWPPQGCDKSRVYDRSTLENWYPRSSSRSM